MFTTIKIFIKKKKSKYLPIELVDTYFLKEIIPSFMELASAILIIILISWGFWIYNGGLSPNEFGDAINPILGGITIYLVYRTFRLQNSALQLQEKELVDTRIVLKGQENAMREQKLQSLTVELLGVAQNHLEKFRNEQKQYYPTLTTDILCKYIMNSDEKRIIQDIREGNLNHVISYFRTLKYIETIIEKTYYKTEDKENLMDYIDLLESQITDNIRDLYNAIISLKTGFDKEKITFQYLFQSKKHVFGKPNEQHVYFF